MQVLLLAVLGLPLAWHKLRGGVECEWVGYWMDLSRFKLGISAATVSLVLKNLVLFDLPLHFFL